MVVSVCGGAEDGSTEDGAEVGVEGGLTLVDVGLVAPLAVPDGLLPMAK